MLPLTEQENPNTANIDTLSTLEALALLNNEDKLVPLAVEKVLSEIAQTVDFISARLQNGGRLFYVGTGTSGRLGVLDASEIPPTYGVSYELVQGVIAGGYEALYKAAEASEDDHNAGSADIAERGLTEKDCVIGLAASGRTPYTIGALEYAQSLGCFTACITCVPESAITECIDIAIVPIVGPEPITGSTRMKSGTAQKLVLNMISTMTMIKLGYVKGNLMTNLKASNEKLLERSLRILITETGLKSSEAGALFETAGNDLRLALLIHKTGASTSAAKIALEKNDYIIEKAVEQLLNNAG